MATNQNNDYYPCPACGVKGLPMFSRGSLPSKGQTLTAVHSKPYACAPCLTAGKMTKGVPFVAPKMDLTSTNHPSMSTQERAAFAAARAAANAVKVAAFSRTGTAPAFVPLSGQALKTAVAALVRPA